MRSILVGLYDPTRGRQDSTGAGSIVRAVRDSARTRASASIGSTPTRSGHDRSRRPGTSGLLLPGLRLLALLASIAVIVATLIFLRRRAEGRRFMTNTRLSIMDKEVQLACRHVEKFYKNPDLSPDTVCAALVTGRAFLETLFEKELGMSLDEFIDQVRVNRARIIMDKDADADPAVVAVEAGYGTMDKFLPVFERITATTFVDYLRAVERTRAS
jgi:AraC-like DNA-binding protein